VLHAPSAGGAPASNQTMQLTQHFVATTEDMHTFIFKVLDS
jgi:hypothetical protein